MTLGGDAARDERVWLVPADAVLSVALTAALAARGWRAAHCCSEATLVSRMREAGTGRLVLVTDVDGRLPDPRPALAVHPDTSVIAVATRAAFGKLAEMVIAGEVSAVLSADQPFVSLVAAIGRLLREPPSRPDRDPIRLAAVLRAREDEARYFTRLTPREREVLAAVLAGRSAAEIAAAEHLSLATVRTHLRAVLTKLGVSSQVAAAAMAYRSCREPALVARMQEVHQF